MKIGKMENIFNGVIKSSIVRKNMQESMGDSTIQKYSKND